MTLLSAKNVENIKAACGDSEVLRHAASFGLTFVPHAGNDDFKKYVALILITGWFVLLAFTMLGAMAATTQFVLLTAAVFLLIGKMWNVEMANLFGGGKH